jgi:hypothetical protein
MYVSGPLFWCLCIVLEVQAIFQITEHQVCLEGDKYAESCHAFVSLVVCSYGDLSDTLDNQITSSVREWLMSLGGIRYASYERKLFIFYL